MRPAGAVPLVVIPLDLDEANALVLRWHRHHGPARGHRFSIGVIDGEGAPHGAAIISRPIARAFDLRRVVEVVRLVSDGTPNVCSMLYAAAARASAALGFERIQTYILNSEMGVTLRAAGWSDEGDCGVNTWRREGRPMRGHAAHMTEPKRRWARSLNPARPDVPADAFDATNAPPTLFEAAP